MPRDDDLSNQGIVRAALNSVPVTKYALGLAAIAIFAAIARGANPDVGIGAMLPYILIVLVLMVVLLIIATAATHSDGTKGPATLMVWAVSLAFISLLAGSVTAVLFGWPAPYARLIMGSTAAAGSEKPAADAALKNASVASEAAVANRQADPSATGAAIDAARPMEDKPAPSIATSQETIDAPEEAAGPARRIEIGNMIGAHQIYEHIRVLINDVEKFTFSLDRTRPSQTFTISVRPGDRYSLIGMTQTTLDGPTKTYRIRGNGSFASHGTKYELRQDALQGDVQKISIVAVRS